MSDEADGREVLERVLEEFKEKMEEDESLRDKMEDFDRDIQVDFESGEQYNLSLDGGDVSDIKDGELEDPDITLTSDAVTLRKLLDGEIGAMEAYAKDKINLDASFTDMLKFKNLL
ncbi:MAG: SCP2 sterol-binding domain-containing protein [Candidatus Thermoplasmatota archaeon]|nr:SCP2 sterol-binding domain-containing protein [Candidatus Thermoplasmatota archaeon]